MRRRIHVSPLDGLTSLFSHMQTKRKEKISGETQPITWSKIWSHQQSDLKTPRCLQMFLSARWCLTCRCQEVHFQKRPTEGARFLKIHSFILSQSCFQAAIQGIFIGCRRTPIQTHRQYGSADQCVLFTNIRLVLWILCTCKADFKKIKQKPSEGHKKMQRKYNTVGPKGL